MLLLLSIGGSLPPFTRDAKPVIVYEKEELLQLIREQKVFAQLISNALLRTEATPAAKAAAHLPVGSEVEILQDRSEKWYFVRDVTTDKRGWVERNTMLIPADEPTDMSRPEKPALEGFANIMGYASKTNMLIIVDTYRQQAYVFKGTKNKWAHLSSLDISSGKNTSPTVKGEFETSDRGLWFYSERLGSGGKFWVRFHGNYLFHSVAMDKDKNIIDDTIGKKASNGCIRLSLDDAEWFYKNVPEKTKVIIF